MKSMPYELPAALRKQMERHATRIADYARMNTATLCGFLEEDPDPHAADTLLALLSCAKDAREHPEAVILAVRELAVLFHGLSGRATESAGQVMQMRDPWSAWRWHAARLDELLRLEPSGS